MRRFFVTVAVMVACAVACNDDPESHVYVASLYDSADVCFGPSASLGYVETPDGNLDCPPTCLVLTSDQPKEVFVSTMCGPYPAQYDVSQTDPNCQAALGAWPAEAIALGNGTNTCASPVDSDGGEDAAVTPEGGSNDAGSDAGGDAARGAPADAGSDDASDAGSPSDAQSE